MAKGRRTLLILEDSPARIQRFKRVLHDELPGVRFKISSTAKDMKRLIESLIEESFAVSLDHDLHPAGIEDAGDGMQIAELLADLKPNCPVIIHTSNAEQSRRMQGVLEAARCKTRLAGAIGEDWIERDWIAEVAAAYQADNG